MSLVDNAVITRIDSPGIPDLAGTVAYVTGSAVSIDCFADSPTNSQKWGLSENIGNASAVAYVEIADIDAAGGVGPKSRLLLAIDGAAAVLYEAVFVRTRKVGSIDRYEIFLQVL